MYSDTATLTIAINEWIFIPSSLIWAYTTSSNHFTISFSGHFFHRSIVKIIATVVLSRIAETATAWSYNFMILWIAVHSRTAFSTYEAHIKRLLTSLLIKEPLRPKSKNFGPKTNDFLEEKSKTFSKIVNCYCRAALQHTLSYSVDDGKLLTAFLKPFSTVCGIISPKSYKNRQIWFQQSLDSLCQILS